MLTHSHQLTTGRAVANPLVLKFPASIEPLSLSLRVLRARNSNVPEEADDHRRH